MIITAGEDQKVKKSRNVREKEIHGRGLPGVCLCLMPGGNLSTEKKPLPEGKGFC